MSLDRHSCRREHTQRSEPLANILTRRWPGIRNPGAKNYLVKHQITAEVWFVANPELTLAEIDRLKRLGQAADEFLDKIQ